MAWDKVRALVFDVFGTVVDWRAGVAREAVPLLARHCPAVFADVRRSRYAPSMELGALNLVWHRLDPWPDAVAGLARLKTRYIIAPLSNGNIRLMLDMAKRAGLPWDAILGAEVAQAYKPMPQAYRRTAEVLGLAPGEVGMVAAHNGDLAAARQCGLMTAFVCRPTEHGPGQRTDLQPQQAWDAVADDFVALADQLRLSPCAAARTAPRLAGGQA